MKTRILQRFSRILCLLSVLAVFVSVNACRTVEPESPKIDEEETTDSSVSADSTSKDDSWNDLEDQQEQDVSSLDSPDDKNSSGKATSIMTTHKVKPGENLWKIASKYYGRGIYWRAIRDHNNLPSDGQVNAGQTLEIPELSEQRKQEIRRTAASEGGSSSSSSSGDGSATSSGSDAGTYVTKEGDNFWKIAERVYGNGEQWKRIWKANQSKVPDPDKLKAGTKLRIPGNGSSSGGSKGGSTEQKGE